MVRVVPLAFGASPPCPWTDLTLSPQPPDTFEMRLKRFGKEVAIRQQRANEYDKANKAFDKMNDSFDKMNESFDRMEENLERMKESIRERFDRIMDEYDMLLAEREKHLPPPSPSSASPGAASPTNNLTSGSTSRTLAQALSSMFITLRRKFKTFRTPRRRTE